MITMVMWCLKMADDFISNLTSLTDNLKDIAFTRYVTVTNVNTDNTIDCREDNGTIHKNVINTTNLILSIDDIVLLNFIDNDIHQPMITGGVNVKHADDLMIHALGLGKFQIDSNGDLIVTLPNGIDNYFSINNGDLIIDTEESEASKYNINDKGVLTYGV